MQCYTCNGHGHTTVTCPTCNGQGSYWKVVGMQNVWEPCSQCGGRRTVQRTCLTCGGTGVLPEAPNGPPPPPLPPLPPDPELLKLTGRWKGGLGRYEFETDNGGYRVTMFNLFGWKIATGQAKISGSTLGLMIKSLGVTMTADLQLKGGRLQGVMRPSAGLPRPLTLRRANGN